jgi:hypothetical protein
VPGAQNPTRADTKRTAPDAPPSNKASPGQLELFAQPTSSSQHDSSPDPDPAKTFEIFGRPISDPADTRLFANSPSFSENSELGPPKLFGTPMPVHTLLDLLRSGWHKAPHGSSGDNRALTPDYVTISKWVDMHFPSELEFLQYMDSESEEDASTWFDPYEVTEQESDLSLKNAQGSAVLGDDSINKKVSEFKSYLEDYKGVFGTDEIQEAGEELIKQSRRFDRLVRQANSEYQTEHTVQAAAKLRLEQKLETFVNTFVDSLDIESLLEVYTDVFGAAAGKEASRMLNRASSKKFDRGGGLETSAGLHGGGAKQFSDEVAQIADELIASYERMDPAGDPWSAIAVGDPDIDQRFGSTGSSGDEALLHKLLQP